jgi:hypothetical protein
MAKQGISTGAAPNDGTGDTLLNATLKINANFNDIYDKFGDGTNLVSFVSFASTAGYSTNAGIASTSVLAGTASSVTGDISINTTGVITSQFANFTEGMIIQESGTPVDTTIAVGFAKTIFRIKDGFVGIGTSLILTKDQQFMQFPSHLGMDSKFLMRLELMILHLLLLQVEK